MTTHHQLREKQFDYDKSIISIINLNLLMVKPPVVVVKSLFASQQGLLGDRQLL